MRRKRVAENRSKKATSRAVGLTIPPRFKRDGSNAPFQRHERRRTTRRADSTGSRAGSRARGPHSGAGDGAADRGRGSHGGGAGRAGGTTTDGRNGRAARPPLYSAAARATKLDRARDPPRVARARRDRFAGCVQRTAGVCGCAPRITELRDGGRYYLHTAAAGGTRRGGVALMNRARDVNQARARACMGRRFIGADIRVPVSSRT